MNRYSKTRLRQGRLPRQGPPEEAVRKEDERPDADRGVPQEVQALLFEDVSAPPQRSSGQRSGR